MAIGHQSPGFSLPSFRMKQVNQTTWGTTGTSVTIDDDYVFENSVVLAQAYGTTAPSGTWAIDVASGGGSFTITSSASESGTLTIQYIVL